MRPLAKSSFALASLCVLLVLLSPARARAQSDVTQPSDTITIVNGTNDVDTDAGSPPAGQEVTKAIDNQTNKYLNFLDNGSGFTVTPQVGSTIVNAIRIYTADDEEPRDPASYLLEGSYDGTTFTTISSGALSLPSGRNPSGQTINPSTHFNQLISFSNSTPYPIYRLTFPTLKNAGAANSMQVGEVELLTSGIGSSVFTVNDAGDTNDAVLGNGVCADSSGKCTLRAAVQEANSLAGNDTINFSVTGTINLGIIGDNTFGPSALLVTSNITINGGASGITIARDATAAPNRLRLFYVAASGNLTLQNLTLTGGLARGGNGFAIGGGAAGLGGAIVNAGTLVLRQSTLVNNTAQGGNGGNDPSAEGGGGGMGGDAPSNGAGGPPNGGSFGIDAGFGGGGSAFDPIFTHTNNGGFGGGGGGGSDEGGDGGFGGGSGSGAGAGGSPGFGGGRGSGSQGGGGGGAGFGGAVFNYGGNVTVINSTLADNTAAGGVGGGFVDDRDGKGYGGGVFNLNGSVNVSNSTIAHNTAAQGGGAIFNLGSGGEATQSGPALIVQQASVTLNSSVLSNSDDGASTSVSDYLAQTTNSGTQTSSGSFNIVQSNPGTGGFSGTSTQVDPKLVGTSPAANGGPTSTFALQSDSPAIDKGNSFGLTTDQRGQTRPFNAAVPNAAGGDGADIGAFEAQSSEVDSDGDGTPDSTDTDDDNDGVSDVNDQCPDTPPSTVVGASGCPTFVVNSTDDDAASGSTSDNACTTGQTVIVNSVSVPECTLRAAIQEANGTAGAQAVVFQIPTSDPGFSGGVYTITLLTALPALDGDMTITGLGANVLTVRRDAADPDLFRIFTVRLGKTVGISGLTITGGSAAGSFPNSYGGGVFNEGALTLDRVTVSGNHATILGGGIFNLSDNSGSQATLNLNNSTVAGNTADGGAGIANHSRGANDSATLNLNNSTVTGNTSGEGGGSGIINIAAGSSHTAVVNVNSSTVSGNTATSGGEGGGLMSDAGAGGTVTVNLNNTIVSDNTANFRPDIYIKAGTLSGSFNLVESISGFSFASGSNNITGVDPLLEKDGSNKPFLKYNGGTTQTVALLAGSPAIDKGNSFGLTTDQRGFVRPVNDPSSADGAGDESDIGAYEFGSTAPADLYINKRDSQDPVPVGSTFTYTLRISNRGPAEAHNVVVTDALPAGLTATGASLHPSSDSTGAGCTFTSNSVNCQLGTMRVYDGTHDGAVKKGKVIISVTVTAAQTGQYTNEATVDADEIDPDPASNTGKQRTTVLGVSSVEVTPDTLPGGSSCTQAFVKVTLTGVTPYDTFVQLFDDIPATSNIPASSAPLLLRVPAGRNYATLLVNTSEVGATAQAGTITARFGATSSATDSLTVRPIGLRKLSVSPLTVNGGQQTTGTLQLECAAGSAGVQVTLTTGKPAVAKFKDASNNDVHPLVINVTNSNQATFTIQTYGVSAAQPVNVGATANGTTRNARLNVVP